MYNFKTLKYSDTGVDVEYLQLALERAGFSAGNIDGIFGIKTLNSVRRFQSANGLKIDGFVGPITWNALEKYLTGYVVHTIKPGDTIYLLASKYSTTVSAIRTANPYAQPYNLQVGDTLIIPLNFDVVPTNVSYTSVLSEMIIDGLTRRYPFIMNEVIGKSVMENNLNVLSMGNGEKEVFYNASHHANEWITTPVLFKFAEEFAFAAVNGESILGQDAQSLFNDVKLYIAPLVNPDGVNLVNNFISTSSPFYTRARRISMAFDEIPFPSGWKANIAGTDLNLNYPADWDIAKQIKYAQGFDMPAPRDFVGEAPLSAPESRAVYDFTKAHNFLLTLSYHTQGEVIYWKFKNIEVEGAYEIASEFAKVSGYSLELVPDESANAGYKDWFILEYQRPGYTIECGKGVNPLPISQFDEIYRDNIGILVIGIIRS